MPLEYTNGVNNEESSLLSMVPRHNQLQETLPMILSSFAQRCCRLPYRSCWRRSKMLASPYGHLPSIPLVIMELSLLLPKHILRHRHCHQYRHLATTTRAMKTAMIIKPSKATSTAAAAPLKPVKGPCPLNACCSLALGSLGMTFY